MKHVFTVLNQDFLESSALGKIELFVLYKDMSPICPVVIHQLFLYFLNVYMLFSFVI